MIFFVGPNLQGVVVLLVPFPNVLSVSIRLRLVTKTFFNAIGVCVFMTFGLLSLAVVNGQGDSDWPAWRGAKGDGISYDPKMPPVKWDQATHVKWTHPIPGKGHGSPIVVGNQVIVATADVEDQTQWLISMDRNTGQEQWKCAVHQGGLKIEGNKKASLASSTPYCDGERLYINFLNQGAAFTSAVSLDGKLIWQQKISDYTVHQGYGSSPRVYKDLVIVSADNKGGGALAAMDRKSGEVKWKIDRPKLPNYASPIVLRADGKDQLIFTGCDLVTSIDPVSGEKLWEVEGATTECVTTSVTDGQRVFTSGGYPKNHVSAVRADGSGKVDWENNVRVYVPSMLLTQGYLYAVADAGIALCWNSETGEEMWKERLGGTFSGSPIMIGNRIYATNEEGTTFVFQVSPENFELLGSNKLGEESFSTPAVAGGNLFLRYAKYDGENRQEYLACVSE
jgi:outer membrane protein assembly factor BamB